MTESIDMTPTREAYIEMLRVIRDRSTQPNQRVWAAAEIARVINRGSRRAAHKAVGTS